MVVLALAARAMTFVSRSLRVWMSSLAQAGEANEKRKAERARTENNGVFFIVLGYERRQCKGAWVMKQAELREELV